MRSIAIGGRRFDEATGPHILGVVNLSPESPNKDSVAADVAAAVARADLLRSQGAALIDVGAQSSNFAAPLLPEAVEVERLRPAVAALKAAGHLVSVDTWRPEVARAAIAMGVDVINDSDGFQDPAMIDVLAEAKLPVILPFISGASPHDPLPFDAANPVAAMLRFFDLAVPRAERAGLRRLLLDPGTGYATPHLTTEQKEAVQRLVYPRLREFHAFGYPLLVALPRKASAEVTRELARMIIAGGADWVRAHEPLVAREAAAAVGLPR